MNNLPIMSVSGIRGIVGKTITPLFISRIAYLQTKISGGGRMVVGRDTRTSGELFARAAFRGIRAAGGIPIDLGIAPTPTTCVCVPELQAQGGIILTASHNPGEYNGYKMVHKDGRLFKADECEAVYTLFRQNDFPDEQQINAFSDTPEECTDGSAIHIRRIIAQVDSGKIRSAGIAIAVDSINGAAGTIFPALLDALGVAWKGIHNKLDGIFPHNPEPRPEHLGDLAALLQNNPGLWGGFAFDPDADRLATMSEHGTEISEEMTLVFALQNILARKKGNVATNLSTSMLIDNVATRFGVNLFRTKIGEAHVVEGMQRYECLAGGEGNGGVIYPAISTVRDGLAAMALILELMASTGKKISGLAAEWPVYSNVKEKVSIEGIDPVALIKKLAKNLSHEATDQMEGLKIIRETSWVHIRASNTEPIIRVYAEARSECDAIDLAKMVLQMIQREKLR